MFISVSSKLKENKACIVSAQLILRGCESGRPELDSCAYFPRLWDAKCTAELQQVATECVDSIIASKNASYISGKLIQRESLLFENKRELCALHAMDVDCKLVLRLRGCVFTCFGILRWEECFWDFSGIL